MSKLMRTSKLIYEKLRHNNVKDVFMYSGGSIMPLIDEFYNKALNGSNYSYEPIIIIESKCVG